MTDSLAVRSTLIDALQLDLIGPAPGHRLAEEQLPGTVRPSSWYLTGFLIPTGAQVRQLRVDFDSEDDDDNDSDVLPTGVPNDPPLERKPAKRRYFPSSIGVTGLISATARHLQVTVHWGDYRLLTPEHDASLPPEGVWQRAPHSETLQIALPSTAEGQLPAYEIPGSGGLMLQIIVRRLASHLPLPVGSRSASVYLVNRRNVVSDPPDPAFAFQAELQISCDEPFVPRPNFSGLLADEWDELVADLHYADTPEYAVGHGVSADWQLVDGVCRTISSAWIPRADVEKTVTAPVPGVELVLDRLGELTDGVQARSALQPLVQEYHHWIELQGRTVAGNLDGQRAETAQTLLDQATLAARRIEQGIELLARDDQALEAFRTANRAVSRALKRRNGITEPRWRAFQLAFILLNIVGITDPQHVDRDVVDLLFFPTGGGKTEAYLGLAAYTMVLRRLRHPGDDGRAGAGVSVIMRYTLRLLTLDQLSRAAGLICALELERQANPTRYGGWPFEIGIWVGNSTTPNRMGSAKEDHPGTAYATIRSYKQSPQKNPAPIPLENCPWCGGQFTKDSFTLTPNTNAPTEMLITCQNLDCDFVRSNHLPIVAVDETIYRRLPAFIIATVDKFAALPWTGPSGALLGGADRFDHNGFYCAAEPEQGRKLAQPLLPPDLIIQDELHLISGPLGTMVGLYETAVDALCTRVIDGKDVRPKIIASTATVRRAQEQIQALFARAQTAVFPPPGIDRRDSFFAQVKPAEQVAARRYIGISAQGRSMKVIMRRTWLALLAAAECAFEANGGAAHTRNPADPYMTVLSYFNNLRELGSARRILEEEVALTVKSYGARKRVGEGQGSFANRQSFGDVLELTSRVSTKRVAEARRRLEIPSTDTKNRVDSALATNMISVGLDIQRLGLMVVAGQPMLTAEYIQATSRVGRDDQRPGLVVTLLNFHRPRDRSHYERFNHFHQTFYRSVEAASATPFAPRALDRGFAGTLVALARHLESALTPPNGVIQLDRVRPRLEQQLKAIFRRRVEQQQFGSIEEAEEVAAIVEQRVTALLNSWKSVVDYFNAGSTMRYQRYEGKGDTQAKLLVDALSKDIELPEQREFRAGRSLRDVEPQVNIYLKQLHTDEYIEAEA